MTDLEKLYAAARDTGVSHRSALRSVASKTGLDEGTIARCLDRAKRADAIDARRAK